MKVKIARERAGKNAGKRRYAASDGHGDYAP